MRLKGPTFVVLLAAVGLLVVFATDQVVPATSAHQAQQRIWLAARAAGITSFILLTAQVVFGLVLSHPTNQSTWKLSKTMFPWHENLLVFVLAFLAAHIVSLVLDPYAGVGIQGTFIPGLSSYRSSPVALGTLGMYALLVTGLTARYTTLLPRGVWLKLHRFAIVAFILSWVHGITSGTDSTELRPLYIATGLFVVAAAAYRYWVTRKGRPTFASSLDRPGRGERQVPVAGRPAPADQAIGSGASLAAQPAIRRPGPLPPSSLAAPSAERASLPPRQPLGDRPRPQPRGDRPRPQPLAARPQPLAQIPAAQAVPAEPRIVADRTVPTPITERPRPRLQSFSPSSGPSISAREGSVQ